MRGFTIEQYSATGWFGDVNPLEDGRVGLGRIPLLLAAPREEEALAAGVIWSDTPRGWFGDANTDLLAVAPWLPNAIALSFFVASTDIGCWHCGARTVVFCLAVPPGHLTQDALDDEDGEPPTVVAWEFAEGASFVSDLSAVNGSVLRVLRTLCPAYHIDHSQTAGGEYFMNHCGSCGAKQGDFYLHHEPGEAFFPTTPEEASRITLRAIDGLFLAQGGTSMSSDDLIPHTRLADDSELITSEASG